MWPLVFVLGAGTAIVAQKVFTNGATGLKADVADLKKKLDQLTEAEKKTSERS